MGRQNIAANIFDGVKMSVCDSEVKIVILGTKKSLVLDPKEKFEISFEKGEPFGKDIQSVGELIENARETAYRNGDVIQAIYVDGENIIESAILDVLFNNGFSIVETLMEISVFPEFANADPADIVSLIELVAAKHKD